MFHILNVSLDSGFNQPPTPHGFTCQIQNDIMKGDEEIIAFYDRK